jgi:type I restriction enzyme S subunit
MSWEARPFAEVALDVTGGNLKTKQNEYAEKGAYPIIDQGKSLIGGYTDDEEKVCKAELPVIIFGDHTKAFKFVDFPFCLGADGTKVLRPKSGADPKYLYYALQIAHIPDAGYSRHFKYLKEARIPLPPLGEQKRIAAILDQADALRRLRQRTIDRLNTLGQAIFHEMFGDLIANERGFDFVAVGDVIDGFETGKNLAEDPDANRANGYRVLKISAVTSGTFKPDESKPLPLEYEPPESHIVRDGDLLFSRANTAQLIGATAFARTDDSNLVLPDKLWRFVWKANSLVLPEFVKELFSSSPFRYEIGKRSSGTSGSMKNIGKQKVMTIEFGLPSMDLQEEFSRKLAAANNQAKANRKLLRTTDDLFASLQNRAFRGEL